MKHVKDFDFEDFANFFKDEYVLDTINLYESLGFYRRGVSKIYYPNAVNLEWVLNISINECLYEICALSFIIDDDNLIQARFYSDYFKLIVKEIEKGEGMEPKMLVLLKKRAKDYIIQEQNKPKPVKAYKKSRYLYLVRDTYSNKLKIGITNNVKNRISQLRTSCPYDLELMYFIPEMDEEDEKEVHQKFKQYNIGREWFDYKEEIVTYFKSMQNE